MCLLHSQNITIESVKFRFKCRPDSVRMYLRNIIQPTKKQKTAVGDALVLIEVVCFFILVFLKDATVSTVHASSFAHVIDSVHYFNSHYHSYDEWSVW